VSLAAYDRQSGEVVWTGGAYQASYASPTLATICGVRQILSVNQDYLTSHDVQTGAVLWESEWPGGSASNASVSQPRAISGDRVYLSKGYSIGSKLLQIGCDDGNWQVELLWENEKLMHTKFTNVVMREPYVYGLSDGILQCIDVRDEKRQWKAARFGQGQVLGVGDHLLVQAESGDIVLVALRPDRFEQLAELPALKGKTWNNPVLYGRYLLVRNAEQAACWELKTRNR
jgi:outer membrane protein assembly factor BamB